MVDGSRLGFFGQVLDLGGLSFSEKSILQGATASIARNGAL